MVDDKDAAILGELRKDSRRSTAEIARKTGIPRVTVHERIQKMTRSGTIKSFTAVPDYAKLGKPSTSFVLISYSQNEKFDQRKLAKKVATCEDVKEVYILGGEWDLLVKVIGKSPEEIGKWVIDRLRFMPGVGRTLTISSWVKVKEEV
jgi:Lrp/AsnC family leucine-responsive transcriptional regulator